MVANVSQGMGGDRSEAETPPLGREQRAGWSPAWLASGLALLIGLLGLFALHWDTAREAVRVWNDTETYNHCFLILPISLYLIWRRIGVLQQLEPAPFLPAAFLILLGSLLWLVGDIAGVVLVEQVALIFMIQSLVLTVLGWQIVRVILFPLFFLVFAIPIGVELIPFFQHVTAQLVVPLLRATGIPVYLENLYLYIPSGSFEVAEACSGVRYLISSVTLGFLAGHVLFDSTWKRVAFVLLSLIVPIFANGLRAYGIVMIAHLSDYKYAAGADHLVYGWIFFSFVTFCLLGIGLAMRSKQEREHQSEPVIAATASAGLRTGTGRVALVFLAACLAASLGPVYKSYIEWGIGKASAAPQLAFSASNHWSIADAGSSDWSPQFSNATAELYESFQSPAGAVDLYAAYYAYQRQGAEVVNAWNRPLGEPGLWRRHSVGLERVQFGDRDLEARQIVAYSSSGQGRLLWHWYWVDHRYTASRYAAKLFEVKGKLLNRRGEAAFVAISTRLDVPLEQAQARLRDFLTHVEPIDEALVGLSERVGG